MGVGGEQPLVPAIPTGEKSLYRMKFQSPEDSGSLKLSIRYLLDDAFSLDAMSPLGGTLWTLWLDHREVGLVDHRERLYCLDFKDQLLPGWPASLPLAMVPVILRGELPEHIAWEEGSSQFEDEDGFRWVMESREGELVQWARWHGDHLGLLFQRDGTHMVLSDRDSEWQIQWRVVAEEKLRGPWLPDIPADYQLGTCREQGL